MSCIVFFVLLVVSYKALLTESVVFFLCYKKNLYIYCNMETDNVIMLMRDGPINRHKRSGRMKGVY